MPQKQLRKFSVFMSKVSLLNAKFKIVFQTSRSDDASLRNESRSGRSFGLYQDAFRELTECKSHKSTRELVLDLNTSQSTIYRHFRHSLSEKKRFNRLNTESIVIFIVGSYAQTKTYTRPKRPKNSWFHRHFPFEVPQAPSYKFSPAKQI